MSFHCRRTILTRELDRGFEECPPNSGTADTTLNGETGHPPDVRIVLAEHASESSVAAHARKLRAWTNARPSDRTTIKVGDEARRQLRVSDLLPQRISVTHHRRR
jgi:hypothetical protein